MSTLNKCFPGEISTLHLKKKKKKKKKHFSGGAMVIESYLG